jgi:hypothetical protein
MLLGSFADRGFANGEGGMMTWGDVGLTLRLGSESTDSVESESTDVVEFSELVEMVRMNVGFVASSLSLNWNFELVPVVMGLTRPVDIVFKKSR